MYSKRTKIIASLLVFMLTITHLNVIGEVLATSLESQTTQTNNSNVEFDVYFSNNKKEHSAIKKIGEENYIYALLKVKDAGYLKNATITANNANFEFVEILENKQLQKVEKNKIYFNQVKNGNVVEIAIPIKIIQNDTVAAEEFSKESKLKLTAIYVDGNGEEKQIEKEIMINLAWTEEKQAQLNMQISKFIPYDINESKGVLLQTIVKSYLKDNVLPVKENKIEIEVPTIGSIKPQEVKVLAKTTKATNGDENAENFTSENYIYDEETNKLAITVKNEANQQGKVSWKKDAQDEFVVNYIYPQEALNSMTEEGVKLRISANSELKIYETSETKVRKTFEGEVTLKEQVGNLVDFEVNTNVANLSKGQIYANYQATNKIETQYKQNITVNIAKASLTEKIVLEQTVDNFVTEGNEKSKAKETYYKKITVDQKEINKILKEEGTIYFYLGTTEIAKIDKETKANEQEKFEIDLSELNINSLKIEITKPQIEGKLNFEITKAIKGENTYSKIEMKSFKTLELNLSGKAINGESEFANQFLTKEITLEEPTSQAELVIDNSNLSTVVTNENVKIAAVLKTDTLNCTLYKDPTLAITFPRYVQNINVKNIEVLFDTEGSKLTLKNPQLIINTDGTQTILVPLEGTQTEYTLGAISKGVNVVITADITVNKLTPNKQEQITMVYTNSNIIANPMARTLAQDINQVTLPVTFVAPTGVVTTTTICNYNEGAETLTSISGEEKTAIIETMTEARDAKFEMNVINNYNNTIDTINILGRVPFKGNKNIVTGDDLSSSITMPLTSNITVSNVDASKVAVYYSENGEASKDLNASANGWTLVPSNLANVKSYLIVITDHEVKTGENISFTYNAQIPGNLQHNELSYENYVVYFNNNLETGTIQDEEASTKIGVTTGKGPVIEAILKSNIKETEEILAGNIIKYNVTVKNTGTVDAQNVVANIEIPTNMTYVEENGTSTLGYKYGKTNVTYIEDINASENRIKMLETTQINLGTIIVGNEVTKEIWLKTNNIKQEKETAEIKAKITSSNVKEVETNLVKNTIDKSNFTVVAKSSASNDEILKENGNYKYYLAVTSSNIEENRENTLIKVNLPNELKYESIKLTQYNKETKKNEDITSEAIVDFNSETKILTVDIGSIDGIYGKELEINTKILTLPEGIYEKEININATIEADNTKEENINTVTEKINKLGIKVLQTASIPEGSRIAAREDFTYIIEVENLSNINISEINLTDYIPEEVEYQDIKITYLDGTSKISTKKDDNGNPILKFHLSGREKVKIEINVIADAIGSETNITNIVKLTEESLGTIEANKISHIIQKYEGIIETETEKDTSKRIMGQVWKDENNNGIKDEDEPKCSDVEVMLFNNQSGNLVTDNSGNIIKETTNEDGIYTFSNIEQGKYTVIFLYDTANYSATIYKKENVEDTKNSDAVDTKITLDGITKMAAITEEINLSSSNIYNIDLGLISNAKFDLKIDKTVSKITVQNGQETKVYEYEDSKLAKKDLEGKKVNNTTVIVEYKIKVTNEGAVSGYVKKIADYMPAEMKFSSELNRDWYIAENGTIYNSSLSNTLINPGESKVVTLTLTKKMTEDNLGLYHNEAEIYEAYNDLGIEDIDSKVGNKKSNEDDISSVDVLITVKTGEAILFVSLTLTIIITIAGSIYFIKKKILN